MSRVNLKNIWNRLLFDSYGNIAMAGFVICLVSGVFLAIPYNVKAAYDSIALLTITNLPAVFFRDLHYWSAQVFLIFTLLHTWEQIRVKPGPDVGPGKWLRLVISVVIVFFAMLSGFILKGDGESMQAWRILESLITRIPLAGELSARAILGQENDLQLLYVHHIATASIFILYIILEHVRSLWTSRSTFLIILAFTTLLSFFVHAPLHNNLSTALKGPWYFIGLQEILHWTGRPGWIWAGVILILGLLYLLFHAGENTRKWLYRTLGLLAVSYLLFTITGYYFRGENWTWQTPWSGSEYQNNTGLKFGLNPGSSRSSKLSAMDIPVTRIGREACMVCHKGVSGFSPAHDPLAIGCTSCHLGDPLTLDKRLAHKDMILIPGNLINARESCGTTDCHPGIPDRINNSLMTTNSGIVSIDRFVFGETDSPDIQAHIRDIGAGPADKHLRDLCANCHLGHEKKETGPVDQLTRGGGCNACHLNYTDLAEKQLVNYKLHKKAEEHLPEFHPSLDINVSSEHCFGCHSRSGRISTNYEGWHETLLDADEIEDSIGYRVLGDKRVFQYVSDDVHHAAGMECIDCHHSYDVMGDGNLYLHEEQAVKIRCEDCHFRGTPATLTYAGLDDESRKITDLRKYSTESRHMIKGAGDIALVNTFVAGDSAYLQLKLSKKMLPLAPPSPVCTNDYGHRNLTCSACHSSWAPTCIGCHNAFDPGAEGYDLLEDKPVKGEWVEYVGAFFAELPGLGKKVGNDTSVLPAIPGMIMTIDKTGFTGTDNKQGEATLFHRLFAPAAPHTTGKKGRECKSCHNNPVALGYGKGELQYIISDGTGEWKFTPTYARNEHDGLPEDAWIGFLKDVRENVLVSTRTDFRPFIVEEQKRILIVGACLTCHEEDSEVMMNSLKEDFSVYLKKISDRCIIPIWK